MNNMCKYLASIAIYFVVVLVVGFFMDKIISFDTPVWHYACYLTAGWAIVLSIKSFIKNNKKMITNE